MQRALTPAESNPDLFHDLGTGYKVWLEKNGVAFGDGLFELLCLIDEFGSISRAADSMDMSYRAAWGKIKAFEKHWKVPLVYSRVGGERGGGTVLTPETLKLLEVYRCLRSNLEWILENALKDCLAR